MNSTNEYESRKDDSPPKYYDEATKTFYPSNPIRAITPSYLDKSLEESITLAEPRKILVILDLNGTLFYRAARSNRDITPRPHIDAFLEFIFKNCRVMVWSSARPHSVEAMIGHSFGDYTSKLDRIWTREDFRLPTHDFNRKVLTIKDLEFVWEGIEKEKKEAVAAGIDEDKYLMEYDQTNTVLIDDSTHKIQLQPYNGLALHDFDEDLAKSGKDEDLLRVIEYLEKLKYQGNVSAYIRANPFNPVKEANPDTSANKNIDKVDGIESALEDLTSSLKKSTIS